MTTKIDRLKTCAVGGRLLRRTDLPKELGCSQRKADYLLESGLLPSFLHGRQRVTTEAAKDEFVREMIAAELERLEELAE